MSSISDLLQQTLSVIGDETLSSTVNGSAVQNSSVRSEPAQSASSILIAEYKNRMETKDVAIKVAETAKPETSLLLGQAAISFNANDNDIKDVFGKAKFHPGAPAKPKPNVPGHKKKLLVRDKGESYKDRFAEKLASKDSRKKRLEKMRQKY